MGTDQLSACLAAVREVFGADVDPDQGFFDLGGDSLDAIELTVRVRDLTGIRVNAFDMVNAESLAAFFHACTGPA
jgi:acyl carrier protein